MSRQRKPNPLKGTVRRFLSKRAQQWARQKRNEEALGIDTSKVPPKPREKKPPESDFVRFMNGLEKRGPNKPFNLYDKWTVAIRERMEAKGVWPTGMQDWDLSILAIYLQELMKEFWKSVPTEFLEKNLRHWCVSYAYNLWDIWRDMFSVFPPKFHKDEDEQRRAQIDFARRFQTYRRIHRRIREHGRRKKIFIMATWYWERSLTRNYISEYPSDKRDLIRIWSKSDWCIMSDRWALEREPVLIMIHKVARVDITEEKCLAQRLPESATTEELKTALFET